jgi:RimJ/RimL family protein N-acetyltransferase
VLAPIRTQRLLLRQLRAADARDLLAYRGNPDVCRYLMHGPQDAASVEAFIDERADPVSPGLAEGRLVLAVQVDGRVIGDVTVKFGPPEHGQAEIGWAFNPADSGKGYATESARALIDRCFEDWGVHRVYAEMDPRNRASARLCERLGMRREAHLREESRFKGEWGDLLVYAVLASEWIAGER